MTMVKTRIRVAPDGTLTGQAPGLPAGEHEAEIVLLDDADRCAPGPRSRDPGGGRAAPVLDDRSPDEIIGYNYRGHFN